MANAVGNGVADDKLVYAYVPDMIRYYLDEDPVLQNVQTFPMVDDERRAAAIKQRHELVFKRVDGSGGKDLVIGPLATDAELDAVTAAVERSPRSWIAQRTVALSTAPLWVNGAMCPRHVDLRPFAVNDGERVWVLPGGLTRVALDEGGLIVNSSRGGGSKDTWVVGRPEPAEGPEPAGLTATATATAAAGGRPGAPGRPGPSPAAPPGDAGPPMDAGPAEGPEQAQQ